MCEYCNSTKGHLMGCPNAPEQEITALSGKIGRLKGVSAKTAYSKVISSGPVDS